MIAPNVRMGRRVAVHSWISTPFYDWASLVAAVEARGAGWGAQLFGPGGIVCRAAHDGDAVRLDGPCHLINAGAATFSIGDGASYDIDTGGRAGVQLVEGEGLAFGGEDAAGEVVTLRAFPLAPSQVYVSGYVDRSTDVEEDDTYLCVGNDLYLGGPYRDTGVWYRGMWESGVNLSSPSSLTDLTAGLGDEVVCGVYLSRTRSDVSRAAISAFSWPLNVACTAEVHAGFGNRTLPGNFPTTFYPALAAESQGNAQYSAVLRTLMACGGW